MGASRTACWDTADCSHHVWNTREETDECHHLQEILFSFSIYCFHFQCDATTRKRAPTSAVTGIYSLSTCCFHCWKVPCCFDYQEAPCRRPSPWRGPVWGADRTHVSNTKQWPRRWNTRRSSSGWLRVQGVALTSCRSLVRRGTEICSCLWLWVADHTYPASLPQTSGPACRGRRPPLWTQVTKRANTLEVKEGSRQSSQCNKTPPA